MSMSPSSSHPFGEGPILFRGEWLGGANDSLGDGGLRVVGEPDFRFDPAAGFGLEGFRVGGRIERGEGTVERVMSPRSLGIGQQFDLPKIFGGFLRRGFNARP